MELWKRSNPWADPAITVETALELQSRYVAAAIGELQAEFLLGDDGAFKHVAQSAAEDVQNLMKIDKVMAFRCRTDAGCLRIGAEEYGPVNHAYFTAQGIEVIGTRVREAAEITADHVSRLRSFEGDADVAKRIAVAPQDILRALRESALIDIVAVGLSS